MLTPARSAHGSPRAILSLSGFILALTACSSPPVPAPVPEVAIAGPERVTVFAAGEVEVPLTLQWEGEARELTISGASSSGISATPVSVSPGDTSVDLVLVASAAATSGELTVTATGDGVSDTLILPLLVADATLAAAPADPMLRFSRFPVELTVSGEEPSFDGGDRAEPLGDGRWRLWMTVPGNAPLGAHSLPITTNVDNVSKTLLVPVTVTDVVTVTVIDGNGWPVSGAAVAANNKSGTTNDEGQATFSGMEAPYDLSVIRGNRAHHFVGVMRAAPTANLGVALQPMRTQQVRPTVRDARTQAPVTASSKVVNYRFTGSHGASFGIPDGQASATREVAWNTPQTSITGRLRTLVYADGTITGYAEQLQSFDSTDANPRIFDVYVSPPELGTIQTRISLPAGFSFWGRWPIAEFGGNPWDTLDLPGTASNNIEAAVEGALVRDDVKHLLAAEATDLDGRRLTHVWAGLSPGDRVEGQLRAHPALNVLPAKVGPKTEYTFGGESWPTYELFVQVGDGADAKSVTVYTTDSSVRLPELPMEFPATAPTGVYLCGAERDVDTLLNGSIARWQLGGRGCDRGYDVEWDEGS